MDNGGVALFRRLGHADAGPIDLKSRNSNPLYDRVPVDTLLKALLDAGGSWMHYYSPGDCEQVADRIRLWPVSNGCHPNRGSGCKGAAFDDGLAEFPRQGRIARRWRPWLRKRV